MSTNKMLIDAAHPEETRVAVLSGNRLHNFDVESVARKQIKGNIYLAKVIRVEPSLQAAFVDYGGKRHGFLSFSEIHPDYYQIPIEDRQALLAEHEAAEMAQEANSVGEPIEEILYKKEPLLTDKGSEDDGSFEKQDYDSSLNANNDEENDLTFLDDDEEELVKKSEKGIETIGGDDTDETRPKRHTNSHRRYKIQEVIKRRQIILIQIVKEERGNKGAALTTYISLAGRYCVLMPNTARGGGISRKITNPSDRKQLKTIISGLKIPDGMAVIVRTAGIKRSKAEIKRDYEYLVRLWDSVRNLTLESSAPTLVHEEGNLIKRSIRDLYARDIEEIIVAGDQGYRMAKDFIKILVPSHAKRVQPYTESSEPIFQHFQVENQLGGIHSPEVQMSSGAYIVINPTEALVSIDVNSGRSTRERNIEETALKTNLEAADEIARQLRLRDLAGLIVIDFIDMEVSRNNSQVEKRLKEAMRHDRARIQIGRISPFGLLEMSRQRLRMSLIEASSETCPHCDGTGTRRSTDSAALVVLRAIQEEVNSDNANHLVVHVSTGVALYILNQKRSALSDIEKNSGISVSINADDTLIPPAVRLERIEDSGQVELITPASTSNLISAEDRTSRRRRRPRRRKLPETESETNETQSKVSNTKSKEVSDDFASDLDSNDDKGSKRRRRGKRGGRRRRGRQDEKQTNQDKKIVELDGTEAKEIEKKSDGEISTEKKSNLTKKTAKQPLRRQRKRTKKSTAKDTSNKTKDSLIITSETPKKRDEKTQVAVESNEESKEPILANTKAITNTKRKSKEASKAAKTTVINIGDGSKEKISSPKKGWWQR